MKNCDESTIRDMALATELARQLCHDFSNFIYNLFIQIEINERSKSPASQEFWDMVKRDSQNIARLLREWDEFHGRFGCPDDAFNLDEVIRQVADSIKSQECQVALAPSLSHGSLCVAGSDLDCRHLLHLLTEDLVQVWKDATDTVPTVLLQTEPPTEHAIVRITVRAQSGTPRRAKQSSAMAEEGTESLLAACCRSLAVRIGAGIRREWHPDGACEAIVQFPLAN